MAGTPRALTIDLVSIQPSKSSSQTYNALVLLRRPKAIYLGQTTKQRPQIEKFCPNSKENSRSQGQN